MVEIAAKETEYKHASEALTKFEPVIEQAERVIKADAEYKNELATIVDDAAIIHAIVVADPFPGIPHISKNPSWAGDKRIVEALSHMVIDKREGVLIADEGLSALTGIAVGEVNKRSKTPVATDAQAIELKQHLKNSTFGNEHINDAERDSQHIDSNQHLKKDGRGGRRYAKTCYRLNEALDLLNAISALTGAHIHGVSDILTKALVSP
jgi:hypothetical protein